MSLQHAYFYFDGRMNRKSYLLYGLLIFAIMSPFVIFSVVNIEYLTIISLFLTVATLWPSSAMLCKRLHDVGFAGWHAVWIMALIITQNWIFPNKILYLLNAAIVFCLLLWPGQSRDNKYGPVPGSKKVASPNVGP